MATVATSLKLPADLKARVDALAEAAGKSPHAFMVEAIEREAARAECYEVFLAEAQEADEEMERTGQYYAAEDVFRYLTARAERQAGATSEGEVLAEIAFSPRALQDLERVFDFYARDDPALAAAQIAGVRSAVMILADHPLIGRPAKHGLRELVISRGKTGFLALYRFLAQRDVVRVLRIRHQRELG